jgi:GNAT superfamily N-acetyltransferase
MYPPDGELDAALCSLPREALHLYPFDPGDAGECRYWRACELCLYLGHRFDRPPDPRSLSSDEIEDWSRRGLMPDESLSDPTCLRWHRPYWLHLQDERVGILAVHVRDNGWGPPALWLYSLYLLPEYRRRGQGRYLMQALFRLANEFGFGGLTLETRWVWSSAVRFYLNCGFSVRHWKDDLCLERLCEKPGYRVRFKGDEARYFSEGLPKPLIIARHRGERLEWEEHQLPGIDLVHPAATLALWLAVAGWPLIRSRQDWERRGHWCDVGWPEGLAHRIQQYEAETRHYGFPVGTPSIPGLPPLTTTPRILD